MPTELDENRVEQPTKKRSSTFLILIVSGILLALFLIGFFYRLEERRLLEKRASTQNLPAVKIMIAKPDTQEVTLSLPSFLVAYNVTPILSRVNGYLRTFYVDIGDYVKKGEILCDIETPDIEAELATAKATLVSLKAKEEIARITAERWERLYRLDPDAIPKEEVDETVAAYKSATANVEASQSSVKLQEVLKDFNTLYAPFDGVIVERNIDIGSLISIGNLNLTQPYVTGSEVLTQPIFKIADITLLRAFVEVPQPYYPHIKDGVQAGVTVPEYPKKVFSGIIDRNANALDQTARTLLTQVNIENKDNLLRPGLYADVKFSFKPYANNFTIPIGALIIRNGPPFVALLKEDNTILLQKVEIGRDFGKAIQIVNGVHEGDKIVLNPNFRIKEGTKVRILPETAHE